MNRIRCEIGQALARDRVLDGRTIPEIYTRHAAECLGCQASLARTRTMERALKQMAAEEEIAPVGLVEVVMARLDAGIVAPVKRGARVSKIAVAAVAAAAVGAVVVHRRGNRVA